ncbi:MAG: hypothetical protein JNM12_07275 [Alphaproteobacteria bacterium]|nr:hypothetical protein [Alphaproteobacteria bacterium]
MIRATQHNLQVQPVGAEPWGYVVGAVDEAFMGFYWHVRRNARRLSRLMLAMLPLMVLLVGSCKTSEVTDNFAHKNDVTQLRAALFPDRVETPDYHPAGGYIARAQDFVQSNPAALTKLTEQEIGFLFGKPSMERRDADARIWQYKTPSCVMDVFFYGGDQSPVSYIDYRIKADLEQGSAPRTEPLGVRNQSKCLRKIVGGDFDSYRG